MVIPPGSRFIPSSTAIGKSEAAWMRQISFDWSNITIGAFRNKICGNLLNQLNRIFQLLGWNVVAMAFFAALLHPFKRPETSAIRWIVLAMWGGALFGMSLYGINEEQGFAANQLHLLFIPIMVCYGFAFLLVMWSRLEVKIPFDRAVFIGSLFLLCAYPMANTMILSGRKPQVVYPPYIPPYIAILNSWMRPNEVTASDMPWAVAWYADRRSVWLPDTVKIFTDLSDYKKLGGPIAAIYLTRSAAPTINGETLCAANTRTGAASFNERRTSKNSRCGMPRLRLASTKRRFLLATPTGTKPKRSDVTVRLMQATKIFGTDGVRGVANVEPVTAETALKLGRAAAHVFMRLNPRTMPEGARPKIVLGKDTRLSGYMLENALVAGITSLGVDVLLIGPLPTPGVAYITRSLRADAGIVLSASHNPYEDNGIKFFRHDGYKLDDQVEQQIERAGLHRRNRIDPSDGRENRSGAPNR